MKGDPTLFREVCDLWDDNRHVTPTELLQSLNSPHRIQDRGYEAKEIHLLQAIIGRYKVNADTRWALYNYQSEELATTNAYSEQDAAATDADELRDAGESVCVVRFDP